MNDFIKFRMKITLAVAVLLAPGLFGGNSDPLVDSREAAQAALDNAKPGDRIVVKNGQYTDFSLILTQSGRAGTPISFVAETGGKVTLVGKSGFLIKGNYLEVGGFEFRDVTNRAGDSAIVAFEGASHSKLSDCALYHCGGNKWWAMISLREGSTQNEVCYNYLEDIVGQGIGVKGGANTVANHLHHNWINRTAGDGEDNGQEPIQVGQNKTHVLLDQKTLVEYNLIEHMSGDADPELISNKSAGNIYRGNTFVGNEAGKNLTLRSGVNCVVDSNYFEGSGIRLYGRGHIITNNSIVNAPIGIRAPGGLGRSQDEAFYPETYEIRIEGNVLIGCQDVAIQIGGGKPGGEFIHGVSVRDNKAKMDTGVMFVNLSKAGDAAVWEGNLGAGAARLASRNVEKGVHKTAAEVGVPLKPLGYREVGPRWKR